MSYQVYRHDGSADEVISVRHRKSGGLKVTREDGTEAHYSPSGWARVELGEAKPPLSPVDVPADESDRIGGF